MFDGGAVRETMDERRDAEDSGAPTRAEEHAQGQAKPKQKKGCLNSFCGSPLYKAYFAYSIAFVSRKRLIFIWPGYSISASIFLAISRARSTI